MASTRDRVRIEAIAETQRLRNSVNGNPRFKVTMLMPDGTVWTAQTQSDSYVAYDIENSDNWGVPLWVDFNGQGKITAVHPVQGV